MRRCGERRGGPTLRAAMTSDHEEPLDALAAIDHELRKPLHGLSLQLELARRIAQSRGQDEIAACIDKAQAAVAAHLSRLAELLPLAAAPGGGAAVSSGDERPSP